MARLEYIDNTGRPTVLNLVDGMTVSIGRNPGSAIYTSNPSVSRNHGRISQDDGVWKVEDLGSSNGTYLNDTEDRIKEQTLSHEDLVRCGDFVITFVNNEAGGKRKKAARSTESAPKKIAQVPSRHAKHKKTMRPISIDIDLGLEGSTLMPKSQSPPPKTQRRPSRARAVKKTPKVSAKQKAEVAAKNQALVQQIKEQGSEIEALKADLATKTQMVGDLERKLEEMENKATRYELELDSITDKYVQIKDQLTLQKERLEEAREEAADKEDQVFALETQITELTDNLASMSERSNASQETLADLKVRITQKDRQLEETQRQLDLLDFELRATREELHSLQEEHNTGAGDTQKLERKINQLREIITDKENVISELRLQAENKDIEIRQARMGMGITDLEEEKQKLLQDYYEKNREADLLRDQLKTDVLETQELNEKISELEAELQRREAAAADISDHPDLKARQREVKRLEEQLSEVLAELATASNKLDEFSEEDRKKLQGELTFLKRKNSALEEKLETAKTASSSSHAALGEQLETLDEAAAEWRGNLTLLKNSLGELASFAEALPQKGKLPKALTTALAVANPHEALEAAQNLLQLLSDDSRALKRTLNAAKDTLND